MSVPSLERHENGFWYIHWTDGRRSKTASTRSKDLGEAKRSLADWLMADQKAPLPAVSTLSVSDLWGVYFAKHVLKHNASPASAEWAWKNLKVHFGDLMLAAVNSDTVADYETKRKAGLIGGKIGGSQAKTSTKAGPATIRRELAILRACLNWCADSAKGRKPLISPADLPGFDLPEAGEPRDRWLRHGEIQLLLDAAAEMRFGTDRLSRGERFLWLALETAARKEAIMDLTWDRVDFETNVIHYNVPGRKLTKKRRASVPISKALRPVLDRAYAERGKEKLVMTNKAAIWKTVQRIAANAGVADVSPHVLRHTAATHMARRGVPLWVIAKILANSLVIVEKVYAKHTPEDLRIGVDTISGGILEAAQ